MARIDPEHLVPIDLAYACDNVSPPLSGLKRMVFLTLLAVARMEEVIQHERYSHQDLVGFFRHQLRMKIRTDRKGLLSADFNES